MVVKPMLRLSTDMQALRLAGNWKFGCRECQRIPGIAGGSLPPCHAALPGLPAIQPGCPDLLRQGRAVWHVAEEARVLS